MPTMTSEPLVAYTKDLRIKVIIVQVRDMQRSGLRVEVVWGEGYGDDSGRHAAYDPRELITLNEDREVFLRRLMRLSHIFDDLVSIGRPIDHWQEIELREER